MNDMLLCMIASIKGASLRCLMRISIRDNGDFKIDYQKIDLNFLKLFINRTTRLF